MPPQSAEALPGGAGIVVFTRDLRIHDNPALALAAREHSRIVPMFVLDDVLLRGQTMGANRVGFLLESLADLDRSLQRLGSSLVVRRGDWVTETMRVATTTGATAVHVADDSSGYAVRRLERLEREAAAARMSVHRHPGAAVVNPGELLPSGGDHFKVFTPYWRRWRRASWRPVEAAPTRICDVPGIATTSLPALQRLARRSRSPEVPPGGETAGRRRLESWADDGLGSYDSDHDDLASDRTSRLSPYLHFGCVSPLEAAEIAASAPGDGGESAARQLCWRDFFLQVLAARPDAAWQDYRPRNLAWRTDPDLFDAWCEGRTGYPVVDAAMRQLRREGFVHNRGRLVAASFLTKDLRIDWRLGARYFLQWLVDGDVANNNLNWQWTAGTGNNTRPNRIFNPTLQGRRYDPRGEYVRRYVGELAPVRWGVVHDLEASARHRLGYPVPVVDHAEAVRDYARSGQGSSQ